MPERHYNKLVRDKIPEIIRAGNANPVVHIAEPTEFRSLLFEKLVEECDEFRQNPCTEELADVMEVIHGLCGLVGLSIEDVETCRRSKLLERGGFQRRVVLEKVVEADPV
jgi:predicted house-cleaning noncanonical NTP pyrophosphatase (MazG superfamily)